MMAAQQIRIRKGPGSGAAGIVIAALLTVSALSSPPGASAASLVSMSGKILGLVTDASGAPQMGAAVTLLTQQDKYCGRTLTDEKGSFSFDGLMAGAYSVRVSLASFMPISKHSILLQPRLRTLM